MARMVVWGSLALALGAALVGCGGAMGMDRGEIPIAPDPEPVAAPSVPVIDSAQIAEELARRPQLPGRPRVAVYFEPPAVDAGPRWRWSFEERQEIVRAAAEAHTLDLFALPPGAVSASDLGSVRLAAARFGAEAVLIVRGRYEQERRDNLWAATYVFLLPVLFAPAQEQETVFITDATLYDVRNGYIYLAAEGEASQSQQRAHVWIRGEEGVDTSRREAVRLLSEELGARFVRIRPVVPRARESAPVVTAEREPAPSAPSPATDDAPPLETPAGS